MWKIQEVTKNADNFVQDSLNLESKPEPLTIKIKDSLAKYAKEFRYAGIFDNFWMWNIVFLNILISIFLFALINSKYPLLPNQIGINFDNSPIYDYVLGKSALMLPIFVHMAIAIFTLIFGIKYHKKLNHLFVLVFCNLIIISFFEFQGIKYLINYFL